MLPRPLPNRVTPAGDLFATEHRGTMFGNRGVLHDDDLTIVRRHQVRRWLVCVLEFRGRRRQIMRPRRYTELFFHDEAVALAAGHRPCAECRNAEYQRFREAWATGLNLSRRPTADELDNALHSERRVVDGVRVTHKAELETLPDGVFIVRDSEYWLLHERTLRRWTPAGYEPPRELFAGQVDVLTPASTVATVRAGYRPAVRVDLPMAPGRSFG